MAKAFAGNAARLAIVGDNPMLLSERGSGQGLPRQPGQFDRLSAGAGEDRRLRHQLEHRRLSDAVLGEAGVSRMTRRTSRSASSRTRSSPPRASTAPIRSRPGQRTTRRCGARTRMAQRPAASTRCISPGRAPTSRSASPTVMNGRAARRPPRTASPAIPTSRPRKSSPRRMRGASTAMSPAPSRCPTRAR